MSYAEAEAEAEASLSRSDSVVGFGVFVMFFPRFDDRIPALARPPPQSPHSAAAAAAATHAFDIYFQPEHEGKGIDFTLQGREGSKKSWYRTNSLKPLNHYLKGRRMACGDARQ